MFRKKLVSVLAVLGILSLVPSQAVMAASNPDAYQVFQYSTFLKHFSNYTDAVTYAKQWDHSKVIDMSDLKSVWDNYPNPNAYQVFQGMTFLNRFSTLNDAVSFANNKTDIKIIDMSTLKPVSGYNPDAYQVFQNSTFLKHFSNYNDAVTYAQLWANSKVIDMSTLHSVWDNYPKPLDSVKTIIIDPGHGGNDSGAIALDGTYEKAINLQIAEKVKTSLIQKGYKVVMVRETDTSCDPSTTDVHTELQCRVDLSKKNNADIYVSIHANESGSSSVHGTTTYYNADNQYDGSENPFPDKSKQLSDLIQKDVTIDAGTYNFGSLENDYYVLRKNTVPAVLVETGFLSNSSDLAKLESSSGQSSIATGITQGIADYFKANP